MAEQNEVIEGPSAEVLAKAKDMGWMPKEAYKGAPDKWVDADAYVERAEHMMPLMRKHTKKLEEKLNATLRQNEELAAAVANSADAIEALKEFHSEDVARKVETARKNLLAEIKSARTDGDIDGELAAVDELTKLNAAETKAEKRDSSKGERKAVKQDAVTDPDFQAWLDENPWADNGAGKDNKKIALANAIASEMRIAGDKRKGKAFLDDVSEKVEEYLGKPDTSRKDSKVAGGGGGTGDGGASRTKTYNDLPKDAKEICARQTARKVGPGRAFKTAADWQKYYVACFFEEEA